MGRGITKSSILELLIFRHFSHSECKWRGKGSWGGSTHTNNFSIYFLPFTLWFFLSASEPEDSPLCSANVFDSTSGLCCVQASGNWLLSLSLGDLRKCNLFPCILVNEIYYHLELWHSLIYRVLAAYIYRQHIVDIFFQAEDAKMSVSEIDAQIETNLWWGKRKGA